jgi:imidazoleglycerol-phosphate dehydratase
MGRRGEAERKTKETMISVKWDLDGEGAYTIATGIPFFDHMLSLFSKHGLFDLEVKAKGDTDVDYHHTVEDVGIAMGRSLNEALGNLERIKRYGHAIVPMDEALCIGDLQGKTGNFDVEVAKEFFKGFVNEARCSLHVNLLYGENLHHKVEAVFKAFGKALGEAVTYDERIKGVLSTKGTL